ncbi:carotenoid 1,2-hydratase [Aquincola tertiaricarbonis]|uniref:Carotenoid 1,2-hydratase n=1 Tax=Aquincola tertiaricarbonis TaxID=391953 RepID=A0ABY4S894_AQUTE|nr:carotenoid 1,2-hydratase [Aquincola tertiaricarbonis]URI07520.1 carotenoid 1,2-hydratase [Aquincola tertiaricarbonis]
MGSVFSPYYAAARRRGEALAADHCAVNLALYGAGGHRWAMTERGAVQLDRSADHLAIGPSQLHWRGDRLVIDVDEITAPWPSRLRGRIELQARCLTGIDLTLDAAGRHHWTPIAPSARVTVALDRPGLHWSGHGYLDANAGSRPLEQDFATWSWCRAGLADGREGREGRTAVTYDVQRLDGSTQALALAIDVDGGMQMLEPPPAATLAPGWWGVDRPVRGTDPRLLLAMEDGPFYNRSLIETTLCGERVRAVHESLSLLRFRQRWVQALLPFKMPRRA